MIEKSLILGPGRVSVVKLLSSVLEKFSGDLRTYDVKSYLGKNRLFVNTQMRRLSYGIRNRWDNHFLRLANDLIMQEIRAYSPDLVLVYNSEYLLPGVCAEIRKRSKLVFFLGDSPFYTPQNDYYLACLAHADLILVPDTFWMAQLNTAGLDRTLYFIPGMGEDVYHRVDPALLEGEEETDVLYVGTSYKNSWGYRKAMLMSRFTDFRLRVYGNDAWERWFQFFPELEGAFRRAGFIASEKLNRMFNSTKLIPVDGNPSILNGVHLRLMEALAAGTMPLIEYRKDIGDEIFRDCGFRIPVIASYNEARDVAAYWLKNDRERIETTEAMRRFLLDRYSAENNAGRMKERLDIH